MNAEIKVLSTFQEDVLAGLTSTPKFLQSKYFYDTRGDAIFQQIMECPEYYPTKCEMEIFTRQTKEIAASFTSRYNEFDLIELGAGDASKSGWLLKELMNQKVAFTYYPVDISRNVISQLQQHLPADIPGLKMKGLNGEYFQMLEQARSVSDKRKIVLFLGSNIGNVPIDQADDFCRTLHSHLSPGDLVLIGFDLKKHPRTILDAYNDKSGFTRQFNLNLLARINRELDANFVTEQFDHFPVYDPVSGACKSYLISLDYQTVKMGDYEISFQKHEPVFMEISQKYTVEETDRIASETGFVPVKHFYDSKRWFLDVIWRCY